MESVLIGEFKGKNTVYRVLPDGVNGSFGAGYWQNFGVGCVFGNHQHRRDGGRRFQWRSQHIYNYHAGRHVVDEGDSYWLSFG